MANVAASAPVDPSSVDPNNVGAWEDAKQQAKDAGILWERPEGDTRSAKEIIDENPILKKLGNQAGVRESLEKRVGGDIETDADAAFRALQVLEHIERFDQKGDRLVGGDVDNGQINGFTKGGEAKNGTEAGRLQDFGKYGFANLNGELQHITTAAEDPKSREAAEALGIEWVRPEGDTRSAEEIIKDNPLLAKLGNQSHVKDMLKEQVGDFETDADAAHRAAQVLEHIETFDADGNRLAGNDIGNGEVNGFTKGGEAKHGTEAGRLQDFGKKGFESLKGKMRDSADAGGNEEAKKQAEALGIHWVRLEGDDRTAQEIIDKDPLLKNLGNQSDIRDMLKEQVGDFETDADAAFRASQVLEHIETLDGTGNSITGGDVDNGRIDGVTKSGEAKHGTEAGRLQDFGKTGFSALKGEMKDTVTAEVEAGNEKERADAVNAAREEAGLPPLSKLDIANLETSETGTDGKALTVTDLAWKNTMAEWKTGIENGTIKADDDRAKLYNALKAGAYLDQGAGVYGLDIGTGVAVKPAEGKDFEAIIDGGKVDEKIATLMESEAVSKDITKARTDALTKVEGGDKLVTELKDMASSTEYALYIQELSKDPNKKQLAEDDIAATYTSLLAVDPDAAASFAKNMQIDTLTMELDALMADPSKISDEDLALAGSDTGKMLLTLIKKGGLDLGRRAAEAQKFLEGMLGDKKTAKEFGQALQELGAKYAQTGEVTTKDVEKVLGKGQYPALETSSIRGMFEELTKSGIIGSLGGAVSLASAIYQLAGKGGTLADTPEERLSIAKDFVSFVGAGKHFGDLANHIIGEHNKNVQKYNEEIEAKYKDNTWDIDVDRLKKTPTESLLGLDKTLDDLLKPPSEVTTGPNKDVRKFEEAFETALNDSSKADTYKNSIIKDMTDEEYGKLIKGVEDGYQVRPEITAADGTPAKGWHKGASAALLVMSAGADTFAGAADIAIGALTIKKGLASGDDVTTSKGALQVAAGGFGLAGGFASSLGLVKGLSFIKAAAAPSFFVSAVLSLATLIPDIINDVKRTDQINTYRDDMRDFFKQLDQEGLLAEDGLDKFRFLEAYMTSYGQRDAPDGISIFDYRSDEVDHFLTELKENKEMYEKNSNGDFFTTDIFLDQDNHEDYDGDGSNLDTDLDRIG
ncbi:hypothetical protein [Falsirhodobacter sp. 20TX0035]|uniref:hypothetical protein n=1 Tax=Falsirhodobacter sp. 20TX0035 TaxID=3022019 RepID=UPI00232DC739|nr:hypothetical protein [Falsirhodobacter sp. 20TX0035]MDB6454418.1 hypothetical protein [Falsirhodobacter sp. 20TX0035]